jgi:hypothetical protein
MEAARSPGFVGPVKTLTAPVANLRSKAWLLLRSRAVSILRANDPSAAICTEPVDIPP